MTQAPPPRKVLNRVLYLEQPTEYPPRAIIEREDDVPVVQFRFFVRSFGEISGTILDYNPETRRGHLDVEGHAVPFLDARLPRWGKPVRPSCESIIGQRRCFGFWPSQPGELALDASPSSLELPELRLSAIRNTPKGPGEGYVEVVGQISHIWPGRGLALTLWSRSERTHYHTIVHGDYPAPDEQGEYAWVSARFDPATRLLRLDESFPIAFVTRREERAFRAYYAKHHGVALPFQSPKRRDEATPERAEQAPPQPTEPTRPRATSVAAPAPRSHRPRVFTSRSRTVRVMSPK